MFPCTRYPDSRWAVRRSAAAALGKLGAAQAVDPLCAALLDQNEYVRADAAQALNNIGGAAVEGLCGAMQSPQIALRRGAARVLVGLYRSGKLDKEQQVRILGFRNTMSGDHVDSTGDHDDNGQRSSDCHTDQIRHTDDGALLPA